MKQVFNTGVSAEEMTNRGHPYDLEEKCNVPFSTEKAGVMWITSCKDTDTGTFQDRRVL